MTEVEGKEIDGVTEVEKAAVDLVREFYEREMTDNTESENE
jgi:hypothetical protein